jgi:hypothetical protein
MSHMNTIRSALTLAAVVTLAACAADAPTDVRPSLGQPTFAREYSSWSAPRLIQDLAPGAHPDFNTAFLDGCPFPSRDGKAFFMASTRPGGMGGIDIWVSTRESVDDPWGAPVNVGAPVNSAANDFCPTLAGDGHTFYFVSNRAHPDACGGDDIYVTRLRGDVALLPGDGSAGDASWEEPVNVGCDVNTAGNEASPVPLEQPGTGPVLYFSSTVAGGVATANDGPVTGDADVYYSEWQGGAFGRRQLVPGVNGAFEDGQPNISRDALELYFYSNRPGTMGGNDIYVATRANAQDVFGTPVNLGAGINTAAAETRPSPSWDGTQLYFGSTRPGGEGLADIYVVTRERVTGRR